MNRHRLCGACVLAALAALVPVASLAARAPREAWSTPKPASAKSAAPKHAPARSAPRPTMPRTLSDVHIEGEIPVPQVLFITARDQRRYMDFQHHRYLPTSTQLGKATPFPARIVVIERPSSPPPKETLP